MEDKKNKRKIFKRIGAIVCALSLTIIAFSLPFLGNFGPKFNSKNMVASANETSTAFTGSFLNYQVSLFNLNNTTPITAEDYSVASRTSMIKSGGSLSVTLDFELGPGGGLSSFSFTPSRVGTWGIPVYVEVNSSARVCFNYFLSSSNFNPGLISYAIVNTEITPNTSLETNTDISYYDNSGNYFSVAYICKRNGNGSLLDNWEVWYDNFVYYFKDSVGTDFNAGYNLGYKEGSDNGYSNGYSEGESAGYDSGYKAGETIGYNNGYSQGVENGGRYTFFSLISAVIDAPIQAFMGLFNFELLGINLAGFFTGLLTLAFIITIVRLVMP